jgi:secreted trypsin-like serine protease
LRRLRHTSLALVLALLFGFVATPVTTAAAPAADDVGPTFVHLPTSPNNHDAQPNIVGGVPASKQHGAFAIWDPSVGRSRCTGVVIAPYYGLTANHCTPIMTPGVTQIRASARDYKGGDYEQLGLAAFTSYPGSDPNSLVDDLTVVRFQHKVTRTHPVPIALDSVPVGAVARVAGWGWTCDASPEPPCSMGTTVLQQLDLRIAPSLTCPLVPDRENMLCAVSADGQDKMACLGDSGGPLEVDADGVDDGKDDQVLVGITLADGDDDDLRPNVCVTNPNGGQGTGVWLDITQKKYRQLIDDVTNPN